MTDVHTRSAAKLSEQVAEEIRAMMARRRISGRQLASLLGVSPSWVSYRLTGAQPIDLNDLQQIADALDVTPADLLPGPNPTRLSRDSLVIPGRPIRKRIVRTPDPRPIDRGPRSPSAVRPISSVPATKRRPGPVRPMANAS